MNEFIKDLRILAKKDPKRIVFPEYRDERIKKALDYIIKEGIAFPLVLTQDYFLEEKIESIANQYYLLKTNSKVSKREYMQRLQDPLFYSSVLVSLGYADGIVAGATYSSSQVIQSIMKNCLLDFECGILTSCFIMQIPHCNHGVRGVFIFADCAVQLNPRPRQLALIAIACAKFAFEILNITPRIALLNFSTKGSAKGPWTQKIDQAIELIRKKEPGLLVEGELQVDAAILPKVAKIKVPNNNFAGYANTLIFPNLESGNISYKLVERLANARAIGPIILGTKHPYSDLSRGCSVDDVIDSTVITVLRARLIKKEII